MTSGPKPRTPILDTAMVPRENIPVTVVEISGRFFDGESEETFVVIALNLDHALSWYKHEHPGRSVVSARVLTEEGVLLSETREL